MIHTIFEASNILQWAGSFVIVLLVLKNYNRHIRPIIILGTLGALSVIFQFLQTIVSRMLLEYQFTNLFGDTYSYLESMVFLFFYYQFFKGNKYFTTGLVVSTVINSTFYFLSIFGDPAYPWYVVLHAARDFELMVLSIALFLKALHKTPETLPTPLFWINAAILFYFSSTFILSLSMDYIATLLREDFILFWTFRNFLRFVFCVIVCVNIWKMGRIQQTMKVQ